MKILFVRPRPSPETIGLQHVMLVEPLELEVMASLVGKDDTACILDMNLEKLPIEYFIKRENPDVLCVTGYITNVPEMISYCASAKRLLPDVVTLVGGVHCEVCPADLNTECIDFRMVRNAVTQFPRLLEYLKGRVEMPSGILRYGDVLGQVSLPAFDFSFPIPDRTLTERYRKKYFYIFHDKVALIKTSFGCPYNCSFCFCRSITKDHYFERPLDEVIRELKSIRERDIYIVDDDFLSSKSRVIEFIEANLIAGFDKKYLIYGRADFIAQNPDVMEAFAQIGLKTVIVGIESFLDDELDRYNKNIDAKTNQEAMNVLNRLGIDCYATIIVSPDWGKAEFENCRQNLSQLGIHYVNLQPLTPLPGTELKIPESELVFPYTDFHKWDLAHISIYPSRMSVVEFYSSILRLYKAVLFQPRFLLKYLKSYNLLMLWKMLKGVYIVQNQYLKRIKQAEKNA